ncbi:MAG: secretin and TonB N-terminal domain-containing protein, partial [Pseudomonadales bacterium]|nr:secretin and TonB N-terminal domain-containing protein [Pseudomonadales bacterium]
IRFASLPNDVTEIRLEFDGPAPEPAGYTIDQPARIAIDLMNATSALDSKYHTLGTGNTRSVTVVEAADRTRMIINLTELVGYETTVNGDSLIVRVGASVAGGSARSLAAASRPAERLIAAASEVTEIDFRRGDQGEGQVIIRLTNPKAPLDVRGEGSDIRVEIGGTAVPEALRRRLDVTDFATPVELIDTIEESGRAVITIRPTGEYEYLAYQADEVVTVNIRPINPDAPGVERADNVFRYKGEKLSLNFQDIEVRSVLQLIADFTDLNLVASDTVSGRITLRLQNVPWDQALDIILRNKGLDKRRAGNVLMVAPAAEIAAREKQELDNRRQIQELAPLRTEFIQVLYADAQQLVNLFQTAGEGGEAGLLSERGSVIVDERTNSIIISETADKIVEFRRLLQQLDIPVRQVLIEARIVNANANFSETLGIRWGGAATRQTGGSFVSIASTVDDSQAIRTGAANGETAILETPVVDLAAPSGTTNFTVGL